MAQNPAPSAFSATPEVMFLEELFGQIKRGQLRSPRFQPPFSWSAENLRKLFDSVVKGYPVGSLAIWAPGESYDCLDTFGPIAQKGPEAEGGDSTYVLDGQHRLATLFGAMHVTGEPPEHAADRIWWMWYDLEREEFTHDLPADAGAHHLPLRHMLATTEFLRFCARLTKERPSESSALVARAEKVVRLLRGYRLPVVRVRGGQLEDALEIFVRLNSSGKSMTEEQLRAAAPIGRARGD